MIKNNILESSGLSDIDTLYKKPHPSSRKGPLFNAFSYPTKISPESIAIFIATHTKPGDTVLDVFGGSGTTGLAAKLCDKPTDTMCHMAENMGIKPVWGPRRAILYEIGTLGTFISRTLATPPDITEFEEAAHKLITKAQDYIGWIYSAEDSDGQLGKLRHAIWSDVLLCPNCKEEITYFKAAVRLKPLCLEKSFKCPTCENTILIGNCERATETMYDSFLGKDIECKKRTLVRVYGETNGKNWIRDALPEDIFLSRRIKKITPPDSAPKAEIIWGDLYRAGYHKGISHLHHFYTPRNFLAISTIWKLVDEFDPNLRDALRLLVLSYNSTHSTLMSRVVVKKGQGDFVLTGAQSGVLYISGLPVEKNVFKGLELKIKALSQAFAIVYDSSSNVKVVNESSTSIGLPDCSVDYVFTDPPFGGNIPYAEVNQINELWLGDLTNRAKEVIVSKAQGKDICDYERLMESVFLEIARVLKPNGLATVVFHSAQPSVWQALTTAYNSAGFCVRSTNILDKLQESFKQVVSNVSVKGDPLLLLSKIDSHHDLNVKKQSEYIIEELINQAITADVIERSPQRLYSRFISRCLEFGVTVPLGAKEFYELVVKLQEDST